MFHRCVGALVGLAMMGMAGTANAILIGANDPAFGAGDDGFNLTQDTDTGLEWLDVPLTDNQSFNDIIGGSTPVARSPGPMSLSDRNRAAPSVPNDVNNTLAPARNTAA